MLQPRSSICKTWLIQQNSPGMGDSDYRGSYKFKFKALPISNSVMQLHYHPFPYQVGDRIGQIYLEKIIPISFIEVTELSDTIRGEGGFGSTGK